MAIRIEPADLTAPDFTALVSRHADFCDGTAPPESCHRLTVDGLAKPGLRVWAVHEGETLLGMGALKDLGGGAGEIKSMHTTAAARGRGIARTMLHHIIATSRQDGMTSLWLETGVHPDFAPARALYLSEGFAECPPFGDYILDPHSVFMTLRLSPPGKVE
jgi:putative acetyltransferase